jgi:hypothetical protein
MAKGNVTLQGRLDLSVDAQTRPFGPDPLVLRALRVSIPATGPIPVSLLLQATNFFANKTVHLRVSGTVRNPVVQVEPIALIAEDVVRFFLGQALPR